MPLDPGAKFNNATTMNETSSRSYPENHPENDARSVNDIRHDIRSRRRRMDDTLDRITDKVNPRSIVGDLLNLWDSDNSSYSDDGERTRDQLLRSGRKAGRKVARTLKENPLPAALIGAGVLWAVIGNDEDDEEFSDDEDFNGMDDQPYDEDLDRWEACTPDTGDELYPGSYQTGHSVSAPSKSGIPYGESIDADDEREGAMDRIKASASHAGDKVKEVAANAREGVASAVEKVKDGAASARDGLSSARESVGESSRDAAQRLRDASNRAYRKGRRAASRGRNRGSRQLRRMKEETTERYERALDESPLALGLGAVAIGALVSVLLPRSRREDQWFGDTSEEFIDAAREKGEDLADRAKSVGERVASKALDAAEEEDLGVEGAQNSVDALKEKLKSVGETVKEEVREAAEEEGLTSEKLRKEARTSVDDTIDAAAEKTEKSVKDDAVGSNS